MADFFDELSKRIQVENREVTSPDLEMTEVLVIQQLAGIGERPTPPNE